MSLCECGCGGEAEPGRRYKQGHNRKGKSSPCKGKPRPKEVVERIKETRRINKEVKEGKRLPPEAPELPFCACGCGGRVTKPRNKYIAGHQNRGRVAWSNGKTKETDERLAKAAENLRKTKIETYQSEEGDILKKKISKSKTGVPLSKDHRDNIGRGLIVFYDSEEGEKLKKEFSERFSGEGGSFYGHKHTEESNQKNREAQLGRKLSEETKQKMRKTHSTKEGRQKMREARMGQKFPKHHTKPELRCEEYSIKNNIPATYTGNGSFWIPQRNNGNKVCNPDFILYANGKKFVIEMLGDYWHSPLLNRNVLDTHYKDKKKHYKRYRWIPIFIWEADIMRPDGEKFFLSKLKKAGAI